MPQVFRLHFDITDNSPNGSQVFLDSSPNQLPFAFQTDSGPTAIVISNVNPRAGSGSMFIKFNTRSCIYASDPSLVLGNLDFLLSMWVYPTNIPNGIMFIMDSRNGGGPAGFCLYTDLVALKLADSFGGSFSSGVNLQDNVWQALLFKRVAGTAYLYLNGVLVLTVPNFGGNLTSSEMTIGAAQYTPRGIDAMWGYIDEAQLIVGSPVLTGGLMPTLANFTRLLKA